MPVVYIVLKVIHLQKKWARHYSQQCVRECEVNWCHYTAKLYSILYLLIIRFTHPPATTSGHIFSVVSCRPGRSSLLARFRSVLFHHSPPSSSSKHLIKVCFLFVCVLVFIFQWSRVTWMWLQPLLMYTSTLEIVFHWHSSVHYIILTDFHSSSKCTGFTRLSAPFTIISY